MTFLCRRFQRITSCHYLSFTVLLYSFINFLFPFNNTEWNFSVLWTLFPFLRLIGNLTFFFNICPLFSFYFFFYPATHLVTFSTNFYARHRAFVILSKIPFHPIVPPSSSFFLRFFRCSVSSRSSLSFSTYLREVHPPCHSLHYPRHHPDPHLPRVLSLCVLCASFVYFSASFTRFSFSVIYLSAYTLRWTYSPQHRRWSSPSACCVLSVAPALGRACAPHPGRKRPPRGRRTVRIPISLPASLRPCATRPVRPVACRGSRASTREASTRRTWGNWALSCRDTLARFPLPRNRPSQSAASPWDMRNTSGDNVAGLRTILCRCRSACSPRGNTLPGVREYRAWAIRRLREFRARDGKRSH